MNVGKIVAIGLLSVIGLAACQKKSAPDVSHIDLEVKPQLFYLDFFSMNKENLGEEVAMLKGKYKRFFDVYCQGIIRVGAVDHPEFNERLTKFLEYDANIDVLEKCKEQYTDVDDLAAELTQAFKYYKYYYPNAEIPQVYFHISGFNEAIVVDSGMVSVSIERYLGADCEFYEWLATPVYLRGTMIREKVVPDVMKAMAMTDYSMRTKSNDVISSMINKGKALYYVRQMMPELPDSLLFDYTQKEMDWCYKFESDLWASLVEHKHLFETDRLIIQKYVGESPFTYYFGQESPGRAAIYLGYKIIEAYLDKNSQLNLDALMKEEDAHRILSESQYRP